MIGKKLIFYKARRREIISRTESSSQLSVIIVDSPHITIMPGNELTSIIASKKNLLKPASRPRTGVLAWRHRKKN